jgi:hypothetical protein
MTKRKHCVYCRFIFQTFFDCFGYQRLIILEVGQRLLTGQAAPVAAHASFQNLTSLWAGHTLHQPRNGITSLIRLNTRCHC